MDAAWSRCLTHLETELPADELHTWLKPLQALVRADSLTLYAPNAFVVETVNERYLERIRALISHYVGQATAVTLEVGALARAPSAPVAAPSPRTPAPHTAPANDFQGNVDSHYTFDNFVEGRSNQLGLAAALQVAKNPGTAYNPLLLYGGTGLGKTHLMYAAGNLMRKNNPGTRVLYLRSEQFLGAMTKALAEKAMDQFKRQFRQIDALLIDDIQFFAGKERTQEEFFHTFNTLVDRGRQIVISADRSPSDLSGLEERIRSRLGWGLVADIHPTTYELRLGILQAKGEQLGVTIPNRVIEFLASRITSNVRELEGAMNRIVHQAGLVQKPISIEMAQDVLKDLLRANDRRVTIDEIQKAVVEHYSIRMADMTSARRSRAVARPRQMAMYLAKQLTPRSLPEIGKKFGGRDHTTVMHAVRQIEKLTAEDRTLADDLEALKRKLQG